MDPALIAVVASCSAIGGTAVSRAIDVYFARRHGVGPLMAETDAHRRELIETLEQTSKARADRILALEQELRDERAARAGEVEALNKRVQRLERALGLCLDRLTETGGSMPAVD